MTRLPCEGRTKTRLIPALGAKGAADFHDELARHAIGRASSFAMSSRAEMTVRLEGGTPIEGKAWLGDDGLDCREQGTGDLGGRMELAANEAFAGGAEKVVIIGTDCPDIDEEIFSKASAALERNDLVFGPALDGGYYLVGMSKLVPFIFRNISWGSEEVLEKSLQAAREVGASVELLAPLSDVDSPEDLPAAKLALEKGNSVSVIIPVINEEENIGKLLESLWKSQPYEIIVADGGSTDRTLEIAKAAGARVIPSPRGRARQMNLGASVATGEFLLFLHADTFPPDIFPAIVSGILKRPSTAAGAFRFSLHGDLAAAPLIESLVKLRCFLSSTPYGDQGIFIRRHLFRHLEGFPEWPVMEDLHFVRHLKKIGKIRIAKQPALTSPRRWQHGGLVRTFLRHHLMLAAYHLKIPSRYIARLRI